MLLGGGGLTSKVATGVTFFFTGVTWWRRLSLEYVKVAVNKIMLEPLDL